jgi:hypothetical protein
MYNWWWSSSFTTSHNCKNGQQETLS